MNLASVTPFQRELATAHKQRIERFWPRPVVKPVAIIPKPAPVYAPIPPQMFKLAWEILEPQACDNITIDKIKREVCHFYKISKIDIEAKRRTARVVVPRQIAMYLCKELTTRSLPEIGKQFGNRDHTTVLHNVRKIAALVETDATLADEITEIKRRLGAE